MTDIIDSEHDTAAQSIGNSAGARIARDTNNDMHRWALSIRKIASESGFIRPRLHRTLKNAADEFRAEGDIGLSRALNNFCSLLDGLPA
jgi:hypothetical protein